MVQLWSNLTKWIHRVVPSGDLFNLSEIFFQIDIEFLGRDLLDFPLVLVLRLGQPSLKGRHCAHDVLACGFRGAVLPHVFHQFFLPFFLGDRHWHDLWLGLHKAVRVDVPRGTDLQNAFGQFVIVGQVHCNIKDKPESLIIDFSDLSLKKNPKGQ